MTQEMSACMLGVRRESVTEAAGRLQLARLVQYHCGKSRSFIDHGLRNSLVMLRRDQARIGTPVAQSSRAVSQGNDCHLSPLIGKPPFDPLSVSESGIFS